MRVLAEAYDVGPAGPPDGVVDVRFNVRLRNIRRASSQLVNALHEVEAVRLDDRMRVQLRFWYHDARAWLTAAWSVLRRRKQIPAKASA
mgnify:CR=1 FL=1